MLRKLTNFLLGGLIFSASLWVFLAPFVGESVIVSFPNLADLVKGTTLNLGSTGYIVLATIMYVTLDMISDISYPTRAFFDWVFNFIIGGAVVLITMVGAGATLLGYIDLSNEMIAVMYAQAVLGILLINRTRERLAGDRAKRDERVATKAASKLAGNAETIVASERTVPELGDMDLVVPIATPEALPAEAPLDIQPVSIKA
jgi:hypothetical protein